MYKRRGLSTSQQTFIMVSPRMILSLALVFSLVLALTDARPRAKRQAGPQSRCIGGGFDNDMGTITIGDGERYQNNEQCCFTISPSNYINQPIQVELEFLYFDVEQHEDCSYDYLTYEDSNGEMDARDCGNHTDYTRVFHTVGWFQVCFHSDNSETHRGVQFHYYVYPGHDSPFDHSSPAGPHHPTVAPGGQNFTHPHETFTTIPPNVTHNNPHVTPGPANFTTPNGTATPTMQPNNTCNRHLSGLRGHFSSPGYNHSYPNSQDCNTTIAGPPSNYTLSVTFRAFDIEGADQCQYDYLQLVWSTNQTEKACGHQWRNTTLHFNITGGDINAVFHSDGSVTKGGFDATYVITLPVPPTTPAPNTPMPRTTMMPNATGCSYTSDALFGEYTLRTGPNGDYSSNEYCTINLEAPSLPHDTVLNFTHFDIEAHDHCLYDSLDVVQGSRVVNKLCGSLDPFSKTYLGSSGNLRLTFISDYSVQKTGFSFKYRHIIQYCNATINGTSGSFATPPGGYMNKEVCFYTILTPKPVQLNFTFSRFDIEDASRCQYDSLTMGEDKLCGTSVQNRSYPSNGTFVMKLSTDGTVRRDGFHMSFTSTPLV